MSHLPCSDILVTKCSWALKAVFFFLLFTLSLFRTSVTRYTFRGLSCLWRIMLLCRTGNCSEELRNQTPFFPWLEQFSYKVPGVLVLFCLIPSLPKPGCKTKSKRVYARRRWGRSLPWLKVVDPISGGDIPSTENNNLCQCLEGR